MKNLIPVENNINLHRDSYSKAILNTDNDAYNAYLIRQRKEQEINKLKEDVEQIKELLQHILIKLENK
jgi:hypothetical protein